MPKVRVTARFTDEDSMAFEGELLEGGLVRILEGQVVTVFGRYSMRDYLCQVSVMLPVEGLVFTTLKYEPRSPYLGEVRGVAYQGEIHFKVAGPNVVGWVPQPGLHASNCLELQSSVDLAKDPLKKADEKTVLDRVLGDDPFPDPAK